LDIFKKLRNLDSRELINSIFSFRRILYSWITNY